MDVLLAASWWVAAATGAPSNKGKRSSITSSSSVSFCDIKRVSVAFLPANKTQQPPSAVGSTNAVTEPALGSRSETAVGSNFGGTCDSLMTFNSPGSTFFSDSNAGHSFWIVDLTMEFTPSQPTIKSKLSARLFSNSKDELWR